MSLDDYTLLLFQNQPDGWVAKTRAIPGWYPPMPAREEALIETAFLFRLILAEYEERKRAFTG